MNTLIIEKNKYQPENYDLMKWVMTAKTKDANRYSMGLVHITKNRVTCTDGHRLHSFRHGRTYEPGDYTVVSQDKKSIVLKKDDTGVEFPDVKQVIRVKAGKKVSFNHSGRATLAGPFTQVVRAMETNTVNLDYFQDAITEGPWKVRISQNAGPIRFDNCVKMALIMPMRD